MTRMHDYWNEKTGKMESRLCTAEEMAELAARRPSASSTNAPILAELEANDRKSIRALRENDTVRLAAIEADQVRLRSLLVRE